MSQVLIRTVASLLFALVLWLPAWWAAGRLLSQHHAPFLRLMASIGFALVGYLSFVNLLGRATEHSIVSASVYLLCNAIACAVIFWRDRPGLSVTDLWASQRSWRGPLLVGIVLGMPQFVMAVSTPYWDEVASGAIHLTAANQFAEDLFPPRHNAFPSLPIKYHYASTMLVGTLRWLTGLSANVSIDLVSTALWLFIFLFVFAWFRHLRFSNTIAYWAAIASLMGGGLSWLYVPWLETYEGFKRVPDAWSLLHRFDPQLDWWGNLFEFSKFAVSYLRNGDGTLSNLTWDIANQFQQHPLALGLALTIFSAFLFCDWLGRDRFSPWLLSANVMSFGLLMLGHAVLGAIACIAAGLSLAVRWLRAPSHVHFWNGAVFTAGVGALAFAHGGMLSRGADYGGALFQLRLRDSLGYPLGGLEGFLHWNLASFGLLLLLAGCALFYAARSGWRYSGARRDVLAFFSIALLVSYGLPQFFYYAYGSGAVEEYTEISKFFFASRLAMAILSAFGLAAIQEAFPRWQVMLLFPIVMVVPLATAYTASVDDEGRWKGVYRSPYTRAPDQAAMGKAFGQIKTSNRDVYFVAAGRDPARVGYLSELLIFGGSVFTATPRRYELTGAFAISRALVADQMLLNGRLERLQPGSFEAARCRWVYARPDLDFVNAPLVVRSRFDKLLQEGYLTRKAEAGVHALYQVARPTGDLDEGIHRHWRPRVVLQARADWDGDRRNDLIYYDQDNRTIVVNDQHIALPGWLRNETAVLHVGRFPGDGEVDFLAMRLADTFFWRGETLSDLSEQNDYRWTYWDSKSGEWEAEYSRWDRVHDLPLIVDSDGDGFDSHLAYRASIGAWFDASGRPIAGPTMSAFLSPLPLAGRFQDSSIRDLGLWSPLTGEWKLQSVQTGKTVSFFHGLPSDIAVPGDYDGDGYDEAVVWRRDDQTWYQRRVDNGSTSQWVFGTPSAVPVPADYNGDGRLDPAYWEPQEDRIYVTYSFGRSIDQVLEVPQGAIPAFVNMY